MSGELASAREGLRQAEAHLAEVVDLRRDLVQEREQAEAEAASLEASGLELPAMLAAHEEVSERTAALGRRSAGLAVAEVAARRRVEEARDVLRPLALAEQREIAVDFTVRLEVAHRSAAAAVRAERQRLVSSDPFGLTFARASTSPGIAAAVADYRVALRALADERAALGRLYPGIGLPAVELREVVLAAAPRADVAGGLPPVMPRHVPVPPLGRAGRLAMERLEPWGGV